MDELMQFEPLFIPELFATNVTTEGLFVTLSVYFLMHLQVFPQFETLSTMHASKLF